MNIAEKIWDLSNAITAFVIVQALTFAYYFKDAIFRPQVGCLAGSIEIGIVAATAGYISAVVALNYFQLRLIGRDPDGAQRGAAILACVLRIGAITFMNGLIFGLTMLAGNAWLAMKVHPVCPAL